jgi:hypothetical protein
MLGVISLYAVTQFFILNNATQTQPCSAVYWGKSKYHRFMVLSLTNRMTVTHNHRRDETYVQKFGRKMLSKEKAREIQCVIGSIFSFAAHRGAEGRHYRSHSNDVVRSTAGCPAMKKRCLVQGWGTYSSRDQNGTWIDFRGTMRSLQTVLSQFFYFFCQTRVSI